MELLAAEVTLEMFTMLPCSEALIFDMLPGEFAML
jgi:hypothetical protein